MTTITEALSWGAQQLALANIDQPRRTASLLLANLLQKDLTYLIAHNKDSLSSPLEYQNYQTLVTRRSQGEPLQYITEQQEFYGREFRVTPAVLIPRPETELIIDMVLKLAKKEKYFPPRILDIGTGSGCIAVTLAAEIPQAKVFALDISLAALQIARFNGQRHHVIVHWWASDLLSSIAPQLPEDIKFDICCANPPYIPWADRDSLAREVREHEPNQALFAEEEGLALIRRVIDEAAAIVKPAGHLLCEIGFGQEVEVLATVDRQYWQVLDTIADLQGIPRTIHLQRR